MGHRTLFVCLFVCVLSDFNPPPKGKRLITGTEILTETHYTDKTTERQTAVPEGGEGRKWCFELTMKAGRVPDGGPDCAARSI